MSTTRQLIYAMGASLALLACLACIAVGASIAYHTPTTPGAHLGRQGNHLIVRSAWCAQSEDSCRMNFRPGGAWVLREVTP